VTKCPFARTLEKALFSDRSPFPQNQAPQNKRHNCHNEDQQYPLGLVGYLIPGLDKANPLGYIVVTAHRVQHPVTRNLERQS